jgi:thioredoxin-like negative regulator of GroEL
LIATVLLCAACSHPASQSADGLDQPNRAEIQAAELALARGDWKRARRAFDKILERSPAEPRALLGSAQANLSASRGEAALARFAAYRSDDNAWNKVEQWQYCRALALATDQTLSSRKHAARALELARLLESEKCADPRTADLILSSLLALADEARREGRDEQALELYLSLISTETGHSAQTGVRGSTRRENWQGGLDPALATSARARAYLAAAELLIAAQRREDALAVLSRGLDELPADRELVQRMVDVLADGSPTEAPAELQSAPAN